MRRKLVIFILAAVCAFGIARFCHKQTAGFSTAKILELEQQKHATPLPDDIASILAQPFAYLDRGLQSYAFASADGHYVLKLLSNRYQNQIRWLELMPVPWSRAKIEYARKKIARVKNSYQLAYEELREETGLVYLHLHPTESGVKLTIKDKIGIKRHLDLDKTAFILQKKATLTYPALLELRHADNLEGAKAAVAQLFDLIRIKFIKGIADSDPLIRTNFGFVDGKAVQIDVGPFSKDEKVRDLQYYRQEFVRITASLSDWVKNHYPELSSYIDEKREVYSALE